MIALIVVGSILLLFLILLLCPVTFAARYDSEEFSAKLRYLFVSISLAPSPPAAEEPEPKPKPPEKKKKPEKKLANRVRGIIKAWGLGGILSFLKELAGIAVGSGKRLFSHLLIARMTFSLRIGGGDAAVIAEQYGRACAVVYPAFAVLAGNTKCRRHHVWVAPDFTSEQTQVSFAVKLGIRPLFVLTTAVGFGFRALRLYLRRRPKSSPDKDAA